MCMRPVISLVTKIFILITCEFSLPPTEDENSLQDNVHDDLIAVVHLVVQTVQSEKPRGFHVFRLRISLNINYLINYNYILITICKCFTHLRKAPSSNKQWLATYQRHYLIYSYVV